MEVGTKVRLIGIPIPYFENNEIEFIDTGAVGVVSELTPRLEELRLYDDEFLVQFPPFIGTEEGFYFRPGEEGIEWERVTDE